MNRQHEMQRPMAAMQAGLNLAQGKGAKKYAGSKSGSRAQETIIYRNEHKQQAELNVAIKCTCTRF
jgi:hypothetical protein